jgi:sensor domain CHASE-containing protein/HAMP domain-containing protein
MNSEPLDPNAAPTGRRGRSLRVRMGLVVGGVLVVLFVVFTVLNTLLAWHFFAGLQDDYVISKLERVSRVLGLVGQAKIRLVRNDAEWNETYDYLEGKDAEFLVHNYSSEMNSAGQDVVLVFDAGRKLAGAVQTQGAEEPFTVPAGLNAQDLAASRLLGSEAEVGVVSVGERVLLLAACPVRRSEHTGASNGWLVFGTFFTPERVKELAETTSSRLILVPAENETVPPEARTLSLPGPFSGGSEAYFTPSRAWRLGAPILDSVMLVPTLSGGTGVAVKVGTDLLVYERALHARNWTLVISGLFGVICVVVGLAVMEWSVFRPLAALDREMDEMSQAGSTVGKLKTGRDDEIGRLAKSANRLLDRVMAGRRAAQEQGELLASVLDSTTEAVVALQCVRNAEGEIVDLRMVLINHPGEKMLRVEEGELTGKNIKETYPKLVQAGIYERWKNVAVTREEISFESHYEGHRISGWYRNSVTPWGDGVVVTVTDITERKIHEQELAESLAELERFNAAMIGREERIIEMKREVNALRVKLGLPEIYEIDADTI